MCQAIIKSYFCFFNNLNQFILHIAYLKFKEIRLQIEDKVYYEIENMIFKSHLYTRV